MLTTGQRKEAVEYIVGKAAERGKQVFETEISRTYELLLPLCTVRVLHMLPSNCNSQIDIAEHFGDPNFRPEQWMDQTFDGIRTLYNGDHKGLEEVALQGIRRPNLDGTALPMAESLRRFKGSADGRELTFQDKQRYDAFLNYAQREL